jgi:hypothetical protein
VITFFFKQYPLDADAHQLQKTCATLKDPAKNESFCMNKILGYTPIAGIISTYAGYMNTSDLNGQVVYPRRHMSAKIYLLITQTITPVFMAQNTIHHWELNPGIPAQLFEAEREQEKESGEFYWHIEEIPLPADNVVPLESILIFGKPNNIVVQTGLIATTKMNELMLPDIFVKRDLNIIMNALYILNIRHFFGRTKFMYKFQDTSYEKLLNE